ncbi:MAG: 3'-5' exonuclease [Kiritimatiellae bacterium]|nr:3'-5' exonuclease [Kiritimatiellia bacterium]
MNLSEKLGLKRPLAVFDIESTGLNPRTDRIVELSIVRLETDGSRNVKTWLVNPEMPIPHEATEIHGITDREVAGRPPFIFIVDEVDSFLADCDLGGYNVLHFDIPILEEEFSRCGRDLGVDGRHVIDAQKIFHKKEPRDLSAAVRFFCGRDHAGAHGAEADAIATLDVLEGQFAHYDDLPSSIEEVEREFNDIDPDFVDRAGRFKWQDGEVVVNFGKKKGEKLRDLAENDRSFLKWIMKGDFPIDVRAVAENALEGKFPVRR